MDTIHLKIDFAGEIKLNNECTVMGPVTMTWFPNVDLVIETKFEKIMYNGNKDGVVTPKTPDKTLKPVEGVDLKMVENNIGRFVLINDKFALPVHTDF
jgi:hypothetical protein